MELERLAPRIHVRARAARGAPWCGGYDGRSEVHIGRRRLMGLAGGEAVFLESRGRLGRLQIAEEGAGCLRPALASLAAA